MALVLKSTYDFYDYWFTKYKDPRHENLPFMDSHWTLVGVIAVYSLLVHYLLPRVMQHVRPLELKMTLIIYNVIQITLNAAFVIYACYFHFKSPLPNFLCVPPLYDSSEYGMRYMYGTYFYFLLKLLDLTDTIFIVLRKKYQQKSFLHNYHHIIMAISSYLGVKFVPGGQGTIIGLLNSFVHVIMYTYYLLAAAYSNSDSMLAWKRRLTQIQMIQFLLYVVHGILALYPTCTYPRWASALIIVQNLALFLMFAEFYKKAYVIKKKL